MFCTKCGKQIDDSSTFCNFCGAPVTNSAGAAPQAVPQPTPTQSAPPQFGAPQNDAPQFSTPQGVSGGAGLNLAPNVVDLINKILRGILLLLAVLVLIGSIGTLASVGKASSGNTTSVTSSFNLLKGLIAFSNLARIPAIISFVLAAGGAVFAFLSKQRSLFAYIACGFGLIMFIFNFFLVKFSSLRAMITLTKSSFGAAIVGSIFLLISAVGMIVCSLVIILKKEDMIPFRPNF